MPRLTIATWRQILYPVRRIASIVLLAVFAATGSGLLHFLHLQDHLSEHRRTAPRAASSLTLPSEADHDENACSICLTLQLQFWGTGSAPLLMFLGLALAFLSLISPPLLEDQTTSARIHCRGPPDL